MKLPLSFVCDKGPISATELERKKKRNPTGDDMIFTVQGNTGIQWLISSSGNPEKKITQQPEATFFVRCSSVFSSKTCLPITPVEFPAVAAVRFSATCASKRLHSNPSQQPWRSPRNETENHPNLHCLGLESSWYCCWGCHDFFYHQTNVIGYRHHPKSPHGDAPEKKHDTKER